MIDSTPKNFHQVCLLCAKPVSVGVFLYLSFLVTTDAGLLSIYTFQELHFLLKWGGGWNLV